MVEQNLSSPFNASSVNTKQDAEGIYIDTIRQLMSRLGSAPDIARRGILIMFVVRLFDGSNLTIFLPPSSIELEKLVCPDTQAVRS